MPAINQVSGKHRLMRKGTMKSKSRIVASVLLTALCPKIRQAQRTPRIHRAGNGVCLSATPAVETERHQAIQRPGLSPVKIDAPRLITAFVCIMNTLKFAALLGLLVLNQTGHADPLDTWTRRNPLPTGNALYSAVYGG